jgi:hypothetical protein
MEDTWEIAELKYNDCNLKSSIKKDSKYRNTYCTKCKTAHMWERIDETKYLERIDTKIKEATKNLGREVTARYPDDDEDNKEYNGIISGITREGEYIVGFEEEQHGEGWKNPDSSSTIRHPMNYYIYAYLEDASLDIEGEHYGREEAE